MKGFIFAAGFGTRLKPITDDIPKPLIPIMGIPAICYSLTLLKEAGVRDVICNLHYRSDDILEYFKHHDNFGLNIEFSLEKEILGTGGGIKKCYDSLKGDDFLIVNSDILTDLSLQDFITHFRDSNFKGSLLLFDNRSAKDDDKEGKPIISVEKKNIIDIRNNFKTDVNPRFDYTGVSIFSPYILNYLKEEFSTIVDSGFFQLIREQSLGFYEHQGYWQDIGTIDNYNDIHLKENSALTAMISRVESVLGVEPSFKRYNEIKEKYKI